MQGSALPAFDAVPGAAVLPLLWQPGLWQVPAWRGVKVCVTSCEGGVSLGPYASFNLATHVGDAPDAVAANRQRLAQYLPSEPCWLNQVHGTAVYQADQALPEQAAVVPTADAAFTSRPDQVLAILTADCLPVVLADESAGMVAVVHAGWRGLANGVLEATIQAMQEQASSPLQLSAWIGPAIGPSSFEVGDDVRQAMGQEAAFAFVPRTEVAGKWWCDLPALARQRLQVAGVNPVALSGLCTVRDTRWYSYRRDGVTGRFATLVWLEGCGGD